MRKISRRATAAMMALLVTAAAFTGCGSSAEKKQQNNVQLTRVETQTASRGNLEITGTYIGTIGSRNSVDVTPLVSGTVKSVSVKVGDHVEAGDVLCRFDDKAADLQLQSAQDAVNTARAGKKAAKDQINSAKKQANVSVTSMEGQLKTLKSQKESSEQQLEQLQASLPDLEEGMTAASQAYTYANQAYQSANALYIQFQAFLAANPDCATTAGLTAVAMTPPPYPEAGELPGEGSTSSPETADPAEAAAEAARQAAEQAAAAANQVPAEKQQIAALLLQSLNDIPLTVEYLSEAGLNTLKEQAGQAQTASTSAASAYQTAASSAGQLESAIEQLSTQIEALEDNIDATKDAANSGGGTDLYDAQIQAAETGVESAMYQKDLYTVTSPISGVVEAVNVTENQLSAQGYPAFTISDKEAMEVSFYVPEDVRNYLQIGDEIRIEDASQKIRGIVSSIGTAVDPQKGLFKIEAQITTVTDRSLLSNTSVSLTLVTNSVKNEIMIPFDAVYYDNDQAYVFVAEKGDGSDKAVRRNVTAGAYNNEMIVILEGLSEGDRVITTWGAGLKDGAAIEVIHSGSGSETDGQPDPLST